MAARRVDIRELPGVRTLASDIGFPECPRYAAGQVYFSERNGVWATDLDGHSRVVTELPTEICLGVEVGADGAVYACAARERLIYRIVDGKATIASDLSAASPAMLNEFVILPGGQMLVASFGFDFLAGEMPRSVRLLLVDRNGLIKETGPEMRLANGMVLRDEGRTLWVVESGAGTINCLALNDDGEVVHCTRVALLDEGERPRLEALRSIAAPLAPHLRPLAPAARGLAVLGLLVYRLLRRLPQFQQAMPHLMRRLMRRMPDGLGVAADGTLWYGDMARGAAIAAGRDGVTDIIVETGKRHVTSCVLFEEQGVEWLVITATDVPYGAGNPEARTGQVIAAPLAEVLAAADARRA